MELPGTAYVAAFSAVAVSAAQDLFEFVTPATCRLELDGLDLGQYSDAADAEDELLSLSVIRGFTTSGSGGGTITPAPAHPYDRAAVTVVERNNTTVATTGTTELLLATSFHVLEPLTWRPPKPIGLKPSTRLVVRLSAPADAITFNGTAYFRELAKAGIA